MAKRASFPARASDDQSGHPHKLETTRILRHMLLTGMKNTRIVLADDQLLIRAGICALIEALPGFKVEAACADGNEAIAQIRRLRPDVSLLDIAMPGLSGIEVSRAVRQFDQNIRILVLSSIDRAEIVNQALSAGVDGYLLKDFILSELQEAIDAVVSGRSFLSKKLTEALQQCDGNVDRARPVNLTARQTEILGLVASGKTTKEIARELGISPKTVEFHRAGLMERLGVHDVTALTRYAIQSGMVS